METFEARLKRFLFGEVREIPLTLLNAIANFFLPQAQRLGQYQLEYPILLSTHAIIQTVAEKIFGLHGPPGTDFYLRHFVDAGPPNRTYSTISADIHDLRNVVDQRWISSLGHTIAIDYTIPGGFEQRGSDIHFNPTIYLQDFAAGFGVGRLIWDYDKFLTEDDLLIRKYEFIADWLDLPHKDPIRGHIKSLASAATGPARTAIESTIQADLKASYSL